MGKKRCKARKNTDIKKTGNDQVTLISKKKIKMEVDCEERNKSLGNTAALAVENKYKQQPDTLVDENNDIKVNKNISTVFVNISYLFNYLNNFFDKYLISLFYSWALNLFF